MSQSNTQRAFAAIRSMESAYKESLIRMREDTIDEWQKLESQKLQLEGLIDTLKTRAESLARVINNKTLY